MNIVSGILTGLIQSTAGVEFKNEEKDGKMISTIKSTAFRLGIRQTKPYISIVSIDDDTYIVENYNGKVEFKSSDIDEIKQKKTQIVTGLDKFRFVVALLLCFIPAPPVLYGLLVGAIFCWCTFINTVCLKLKNGNIVKIYFQDEKDSEMIKKAIMENKV